MLESWYRDLVVGLRGLRKSPVFCLTAIVTLALGIGANTAVFTLLYGLFLRSLPVASPQQLVRFTLTDSIGQPTPLIRWRLQQQLRTQQHSFTDISTWRNISVTIPDRDGTLRSYDSDLVSGNGFALFGMRPYLGRLLDESDDVRGGPAGGWPVVLSYGFWQEHFGGDPRVIGTTIKLSNVIGMIVGVTPPAFHGVLSGFDAKLHLPFHAITELRNSPEPLESASSFEIGFAIARLKPGVSIDAANAEIAVYQQELLKQFSPPEYVRSPRFRSAKLVIESARRGLPTVFGRLYAAPIALMQGLVAIVLLLCCVNVSGLMMSKIHERQHEFALRTALGAGRTRLMRQYLTESFVIAAAGAALGSWAAWYGSGLLVRFFRDPNMTFGLTVEPDNTVFVVTSVFAVLTTLMFGLMPAWRAGRADPGSLLKSRSSAQRQIGGRVFVAIQVALSLVLIALAMMMSQSLTRLRGEYTGFDVNHVTIQTAPFSLLPQKGVAKLDLYQRMVDSIDAAPGVESAAVTWYTPMTGYEASASFHALSGGERAPEDPKMAYNEVGPGYFRTMKTRIVEGREFERQERDRNVCVLNQAAARYLFPGQSALGAYVRSDDVKAFTAPVICRVVGIAEDAKFASLRTVPPRTLYFPVTTAHADQNLVFLINAPTKAVAIAAYRDALREHAPTIPLVLFATLQEQMDAALGSERAITSLSTFFGIVALFLSAIGLYGMLSSSVTQRTGEIGIRVALGAPRGAVLRMVLSDALRLVAVGLLLGAVALSVAVRSVTHMLYGVSAFDPLTLMATAALLTIVALLAGLIPALRAASVDPMSAMRAE